MERSKQQFIADDLLLTIEGDDNMKKDKKIKKLNKEMHKTYDRLINVMQKDVADEFLRSLMIEAVQRGDIDLDSARNIMDELNVDFIL